MQSSEAAFRRKCRQWRGSGFAAGEKVPPECRRTWEQGSETRLFGKLGGGNLNPNPVVQLTRITDLDV